MKISINEDISKVIDISKHGQLSKFISITTSKLNKTVFID